MAFITEKTEVATHGRSASDAIDNAIVLHDEPFTSGSTHPFTEFFDLIPATAGTPFCSRRNTSCRRTFCFLHQVGVV
jgi:hypothetical protein